MFGHFHLDSIWSDLAASIHQFSLYMGICAHGMKSVIITGLS